MPTTAASTTIPLRCVTLVSVNFAYGPPEWARQIVRAGDTDRSLLSATLADGRLQALYPGESRIIRHGAHPSGARSNPQGAAFTRALRLLSGPGHPQGACPRGP